MNLDAESSATAFRHLTAKFAQNTSSLGCADLAKYCWYHTVDLGNGLITPGWYDYRQSLAAFDFPADMQGVQVLDIGSATGFFAFEFERRGANVTSTELPSFEGWDRFPGETSAQTLAKFIQDFRNMEQGLPLPDRRAELFETWTPGEIYHYSLDGPFKFCHTILGSKVRRCYSTVYDLSKAELGRDSFDLVFMGDVLLHTLYPLKALATAAQLCSGTMILAQELPEPAEARPAMIYIGGDRVGHDSGVWWLPNRACLEQILKKLGFREVSLVGEHAGYMRPFGTRFKRQIVRATR